MFAVIWGLCALLWVLFFLLLALGRDHLARFTGAVALGEMSATS